MSALVKKEIRLLLPAWIVATLLALVQAATRPYDFYIASLLFFGMTMMALSSIGRETSLNTFSAMLAQPVDRARHWQAKLSVLAVAFLATFLVWVAAYGIAFMNSTVSDDDAENSYNLFIAICLIATSTFTGGLWTTLLLRQPAAAFWLTLLVPATLCGFATGTYSYFSESSYYIITILCVILGIYSVGGFFFARWLYFRAQDTGWSGLVITLPEWKLFARATSTAEDRRRRPIFALLKKELQLQQGVLTGVAGLFVLHCGIIGWRMVHTFPQDSAAEALVSIFWMLWLVVPVILGCMAVAEERKLGMMEAQLCLPVSRRVQFLIKAVPTLLVGTLLGGVLPIALESAGIYLHTHNPLFSSDSNDHFSLLFGIFGLAASLALASFFASTIAKNFLQAIGFALVTFVGCVMIFSTLVHGRMIFFDSIPVGSTLLVIIAVPTIAATLLLLAYLNFKNFRDGWVLWRRNLLGIFAALVFIAASSTALYNRAWEIFEPAEPAHGAARFSRANPPTLTRPNDLQVGLSDGRVWTDSLNDYEPRRWWELVFNFFNPLPKSYKAGFLAGSDWASVVSYRNYFVGKNAPDAFTGVKTDGTLWHSTAAAEDGGGQVVRFGDETNWHQVARSPKGILLLKNDGTLWLLDRSDQLPWWKLKIKPAQVGADSKWTELFSAWPGYIRKSDGTVWHTGGKNSSQTSAEIGFYQDTNLDQVDFRTLSFGGNGLAYVRPDGTLWAGDSSRQSGEESPTAHFLQVGKETNWLAVALSYHMMVALKNDGSLWQWNFPNRSAAEAAQISPVRMSIHNDWVAIVNLWGGAVALAADGSLWLWPDRPFYDYNLPMKLPKQPQRLGNIFSKSD